MLGLDPDLKQLLDEARGCDDPAAADRARVTRALAARLGAGALAAATVSTAATAATAKATATAVGSSAVRTAAMAGLGSGLKLAGVVALAGTLGVGASVAMRSRQTREGKPIAVEQRALPAAPSTSPAAPVPTAAGGAQVLEEELYLLREAQQAMREARPERALALVDEHARRFPEGLLRQERIAVRVLALCALGRSGQARRESQGFLREWPASPFATQIRASCGEPRR